MSSAAWGCPRTPTIPHMCVRLSKRKPCSYTSDPAAVGSSAALHRGCASPPWRAGSRRDTARQPLQRAPSMRVARRCAMRSSGAGPHRCRSGAPARHARRPIASTHRRVVARRRCGPAPRRRAERRSGKRGPGRQVDVRTHQTFARHRCSIPRPPPPSHHRCTSCGRSDRARPYRREQRVDQRTFSRADRTAGGAPATTP